MRRVYGYVADDPEQAAPDKIPVFDQSHVDYLIKIFRPAFRPGMDVINKGAETTFAYVCLDQGNQEVIDHIVALIASRKV